MELIINKKETKQAAESGRLTIDRITVLTNRGNYRFRLYKERKQIECVENPYEPTPTLWDYDNVFDAVDKVIRWYEIQNQTA